MFYGIKYLIVTLVFSHLGFWSGNLFLIASFPDLCLLVPLNLLQYVSDFKTRLSKACEAARTNLKSAQNKMKVRYDENAQDRNFEPGDKVLALLPIPGHPLQARYFGPYTVDKKLSDANYIVNTPGRRKQKQLCHINMLKKYIDRDSNVISSVNIVNSVPHEQNQMD